MEIWWYPRHAANSGLPGPKQPGFFKAKDFEMTLFILMLSWVLNLPIRPESCYWNQGSRPRYHCEADRPFHWVWRLFIGALTDLAATVPPKKQT
jgi:hypothetical protein